MTWGRFGSKF